MEGSSLSQEVADAAELGPNSKNIPNAGALIGSANPIEDTISSTSRPWRPPLCEQKVLTTFDFSLEHQRGKLDGCVTLGPGSKPRPVVLVNCGCYNNLRSQLLEHERPVYAQRGYAYVVAWQTGSREEIADQVFLRWKDDAVALLDWLGCQPWCDGQVGTHGVSLIGSTAFAAAQASFNAFSANTCSSQTQGGRARVCALAPTISFSRIQPTVYVGGESLALELVLRFLWLAELGAREGGLSGIRYGWGMFSFFLLPDFPGIWASTEKLTSADTDLWNRENSLLRGGLIWRSATDPFWREGRDVLCDIEALGELCPPLHISSGWWDIFLRQSLQDFQTAQRARGLAGGVRLTVYCGGHFGVGSRGAEYTYDVLALYDRHLLGQKTATDLDQAVRLEVFNGRPGEFWTYDSWPPTPQGQLDLFIHPTSSKKLGTLAYSTPSPSATNSLLSFTYKPWNPTPYAGGGWLNFQKDGPKEQYSIENRSDVLVCTSPPLETTMDVVGMVNAELHVRSSAPETDFIARLCLVHQPKIQKSFSFRQLISGNQCKSINLCEGIARVNFRSTETNDGFVCLKLEVGPICCRFNAGERIRLQICSAAHPKYQRHPLNSEGDWLNPGRPKNTALQEVLSDSTHPSFIQLPLR